MAGEVTRAADPGGPWHELIDAGAGRRLERFGHFVLDRPAPAIADVARGDPGAWTDPDGRYDRPAAGGPGRWMLRPGVPRAWTVRRGVLVLELRPSAGGQVGLFPEQAPNWDWLTDRVRVLAAHHGRPPRILHLFAYTGGSTLAAAAAGAEVVHLDAARGAVAWARTNAALSGLAEHPIRWLVDDALEFVRREARRRRWYDGVVLDPPTFGRGHGGRTWRIDSDLPGLLDACAGLGPDRPPFVLLTGHTEGLTAKALALNLASALGVAEDEIEAVPLVLAARSGRSLPVGVASRWPGPRARPAAG